MRGNLFGSFANRLQKRVSKKRSTNRIGHRFAGTAVQIDAGMAVTGQQQSAQEQAHERF